MANKSTSSKSVTILAGVLFTLAIIYSWFISQNLDQRTGNAYYTIIFLVVISIFFFKQSRNGKSAKYLATKEDIGKFTIFPALTFKHYLIIIFTIFGAFFLLIWLLPILLPY